MTRYLLDANVFIQAKNLHYGFDFCPAFWDWLVAQNGADEVASIEKVADELYAGADDLSAWARARGDNFFLAPDDTVPDGRWSEPMLSDIVEVRYLEAYRLFLRFSDGRAGELDLQPVLDFTGVFAPLRDTAYFAQVRVEPDTGTIVWPNGADLDPDVLHHRLTGEPLPGQGPTRRTG